MAHEHKHKGHGHSQGHGHGHGHGHGKGYKFDPAHLDKLRDPERLAYLNPDTIWDVIGTVGTTRDKGGPPRVIVDVGAGLGFFAVPFARKIPEGVVFACDLSAEMLGHLREALKHERVENVTPLQSAEVTIPLSDQVADVVFMSNLHHELDDPAGSLDECLRLLRPGGVVVVIDWKPEETPMGPPVEVRVPPERVREQLETAGFQAITDHALLPYHYFVTGEKPGGC